jgi:tetratricopeptide (TPR) repeat protein
MTRVESCIKHERWKEAQRLIRRALRAEPDSHWYWATLGLTYHEQFDYDKSLECAEKALELAPHCPLVLWHYAGALHMQGLAKEALAVWKKLIKRGVNAIAHGECGEGIASARSLVNDCNYRVASCYAWIGQKALAARYFRRYLENRHKGVRSVYSLADVKKEFAEIGE